MGPLEATLKTLALDRGATAVGIATADRLPSVPSADPHYLLPGTRSLISIMVALDDGVVDRYLAKEDHDALFHHETAVYRQLHRIAETLVRQLRRAGYGAATTWPNLDYRFKRRAGYRALPHPIKQRLIDWFASDAPAPIQRVKRALLPPLYRRLMRVTSWRLTPSFAHRYGAVAAGLGVIGWSGNVLHPDHGARVLYHTVLTTADLAPDEMMDEDLCDGCRRCARACQSGYIHLKDRVTLEIGGRTHTHNRKADNLRCILVCGGFTGQSRDPTWSTWSEGRIRLPDDDADLQRCWDEMVEQSLYRDNHASRTLANLVHHSEYGFVHRPRDRFQPTCGYCQFVCAATRERRNQLYRTITGRQR